MATLTVNGVKVTVDDSFRTLTPEQQEATVNEIASQLASGPSEAPERSGGIDGAIRALGRGVLGVGSYLDELNAATNATLAPVVDPLLPDSFEKLPGETWAERYDQALGIQRRKDEEFDNDNPALSTGLKVAGGVGSGVALLRAAPVVGNLLLGNAGTTLPARIAATGATGAVTGAVQGFGSGERGAAERARQAGAEAVLGGVASLALMPAAAGLRKGIEAGGRAIFGETSDALSSLSKDARKYVVQDLADPNKVATYRDRITELGPEGMLADVSPDWLGVARGAAARPGTRSMVVDPLTERASLANSRLRSDMDASLGPAPIPSRLEREIAEGQDLVAKGYGPVMAEARAVDTAPLADRLDALVANIRGPEQRAIREVRGYLNIPGTDVLDPNPQALLATRQAIDGLLANEANPQVARQLAIARQEVDGILSEAAPGVKNVDAQFAELARQRNALGQGRPILNNEASALRPQEVEEMLIEGAAPQGRQVGPSAVPTRMRQAARAEIDRAVGTKANDTTALRNVVRGEGDWNRDKLGLLFGRENADNALRAIDREAVFGDTANRVVRGSDTAMANRFSKYLDDVARSGDIPSDTTLAGMGVRGLRAVASALMQKNSGASAALVAEDVGRLSVARGEERDAIIAALLRRGEQNVIDEQRAALVRALLQSSGRASYPAAMPTN